MSDNYSSDTDMEACTPPEVRKAAIDASGDLLPSKSKRLYMNAYSKLKIWCESKKIVKLSENVLLAYFQEKANNNKISTLWSNYSMLKTTLSIKENIDISRFFKLTAFLKQKNSSYKPKKSKVFSKGEIDRFIKEAPDNEFLSKKAILVVGVAGACRTDELCKMVLDDVNVREDIIIINIPNTKNGTSRKFVIVEPEWSNVLKKYLANRPTDIKKLFISYRKGKHARQNIGHNTISKVPYAVAQYLRLESPECYTGHSLRRSSATLLAENGGDLLSLKRHGGWKSATVAEGYIAESIADKKRIANLVQKENQASFDEHQNLPSTSFAQRDNFLEENFHADDFHCEPSHDEYYQNTTTIHNSEVNLPVNNINSINTKNAGIHMICHNCTINYNFK